MPRFLLKEVLQKGKYYADYTIPLQSDRLAYLVYVRISPATLRGHEIWQ